VARLTDYTIDFSVSYNELTVVVVI